MPGMHEPEKQKRFIELRAKGWTFDRMATELGVCRRTLIAWSRKFQFEIQNLHAIELEALRHLVMDDQEKVVRQLGAQLKAVEAALATRDVGELSTAKLFALAQSLRRQIQEQTGPVHFGIASKDIPDDEMDERSLNWKG